MHTYTNMHRKKRIGWIQTLFLFCMVCSCPCPAVLPDDGDSSRVLSLNGAWKFKLVLPEETDTQAAFFKPEYDDSSWDDIPVPSNWEMHGFEEPRYGTPSNTIGLYRRRFSVPPEWKPLRIMIQLEGVLYGYELWINGRRAGMFESGYQPAQYEITPFLDWDSPNTLAVRVYKDFQSLVFDTHDDWALSGIYRDVFLFASPVNHIEDLTITTRVSKDLREATVCGQILIGRFYPFDYHEDVKESFAVVRLDCQMELYNPEGHLVKKLKKSSPWPVCARHVELPEPVFFEISEKDPKLWNAEDPKLYSLTISLYENDTLIQTLHRQIGLREITIEGDVLKLNHRPFKIRGVCRHPLFPDVGRALREEHWIQDLELMKNANINGIRMVHNPPHPRFLDLCDRYGMYVLDEVPFDGGDEQLYNPGLFGSLLSRAHLTVQRDKNHPCVIGWTIGNENPCPPSVARTAQYVKMLDSTRPVMLPQNDNRNSGLPRFIDMFAPHYKNADVLRAWGESRDPQRPILLTEYNHAFGGAFGALAAKWEVIQKYDNFAGGMIWHWSDQGLVRKVNGRTVYDSRKTPFVLGDKPSALSGDFWLDSNTILDSHGYYGTDGIVYAHRVPQEDYWQTRKAYSPVIINEKRISVRPGPHILHLTVQNRYDFTNLDTVACEWQLRRNTETVEKGVLDLKVPARKTGTVKLPLHIPEDFTCADYTLRITMKDSHKRGIYEHTIQLTDDSGRPDYAELMGASLQEPEKYFDSPVSPAMEEKGKFEISLAGGGAVLSLAGEENHGQLRLTTGDQGAIVLADSLVLRTGRNPTIAERRMYSRQGKEPYPFWEPYLLFTPKLLRRQVESKGELRIVRSAYEFRRPEKSDEKILADVILEISPKGWVDVCYRLTPVGSTDYLLEFGLGLALPGSMRNFAWLGDGPYSSHPDKSELAERGIYRIRPDDLYFEGNRANVDLAALTDDRGNGVGLVGKAANFHCETYEDRMIITHNAMVSGLGTKSEFPKPNYPAQDVRQVYGVFRLVPLQTDNWPEPFALFLP